MSERRKIAAFDVDLQSMFQVPAIGIVLASTVNIVAF